MKIYLSPLAEFKLTRLLAYLEEEWSNHTKNKFLVKLKERIKQISTYPNSYPETEEIKGVFRCVVTNQTSLYYRFNGDEIEIITITDNRQDPDKILKEIRIQFSSQ